MTPLRRAHLAFIPLALMGWLCAAIGLVPLKADGPLYPEAFEAGPLVPQPYMLPVEHAAWVIYCCDEADVPVWLLCRVIQAESGWNPNANRYRSSARYNQDGSRDLGLAQINERALPDLVQLNDGVPVDPFDVKTSIKVCARILGSNYRLTGSWRTAVMCYNAGLWNWEKRRFPQSTVNYCRWIMGTNEKEGEG
jgi:hypothetical protein